jgi:hypothetical protein
MTTKVSADLRARCQPKAEAVPADVLHRLEDPQVLQTKRWTDP